ncbi:uncharacterized protein EAF01_009717 [Botrytis porri]|uniref:uncharacterized protein n=1 Tax=Botrytis porri TaxID=87229 RepID=UPI001900C8C0|nr:uncharacterized protein EAF01_009717 [Botrytis porri]KAF7895755.1 hypothetical protein EAF01_009717 [Botrytis porri]
MRCKAIKTIVAVMHSFGEGSAHPSHLPIPAILAYDETYDNAIKCPYIIQRRAAGDDLKEWYKVLDSQVPATGPYDLTDRLRIAEEIAKFLARTENGSQLQVYGTLINGLGMLAKDIEFSGEKMEVRIRGPSVGTVQIPSLLHHIDMIERLIEAWIKILSPGAGAAQAEYQNVVELKGIFQQMKQEGRLDRVSSAATLWHQDLYPRNIMFNRAGVARELKLTAVIDWDGAMVLPRIMTRRPPHWLWKYNELHENHRKIIKNHFYTYMERLVPGYREDAEGREARVVRALYVYAFWGPEYGYHTELSFKELLKEWEKMGVEEMF